VASDAAAALAFLQTAGLMQPGAQLACVPLTGGVSSDIWKVDLPGRSVCVKRALPRLRVAQVWEAPVERNRYERLWMETVAAIVPGAVPGVLAGDDSGFLAMAYLAPEHYPLWKAELAAGRSDPVFAGRVGAALARIHARTAHDAALARTFATDACFHAIRLEPYLLAAARAHPALAAPLQRLVSVTAQTRVALVHGDVSPKNILIGPQGPVFLDAECAWYGDPAFDLAFCLNHLLLKCLWVPRARNDFLAAFDALATAHLAGCEWEPVSALEARAAALLPGLMLARVDGKSPLEYLTEESDKARVRRVASALLMQPVARLSQVRAAWQQALDA